MSEQPTPQGDTAGAGMAPPEAPPQQAPPDTGQQTAPEPAPPIPPQQPQQSDAGQPQMPPEMAQAFFAAMQQAREQAPQGEPQPSPGQPQDTPPGAPADIPEEIAKKASVPEHWDKYETPEGVPAAEALKRMAHRMQLTQAQFEGVVHNLGTYTMAQKMAEKEAMRIAGAKFIQEEWKDNAEYHLNLARRALRTVDTGGELQRMLDDSGLGNHPVVLKFFNKLGQQMREGGFLRGDLRKPAGRNKTPAQRLFPNHPTQE